MKAARPDHPSAEPILLNQAALEHVLDVFLPEDPAAATAGDRARTSAADAAESFFGSETADVVLNDVAIRAEPEFDRPWRTYSPRTEADSAGPVEWPTRAAASPTPPRVAAWAIAAAVLIGVAAGGSIAVRPLLNRTLDVVPTDNQAAAINLPLLVPAPRAIAMTAASPVASPVDAGRDAGPETSAIDVVRPVAGAVLKGTLTPDAKAARAREASPPPERTLKPPPIAATAVSTPSPAARSNPPVPVAELTPVPPVEAPPAPSAPAPSRDAGPITREPPPAAAAPPAPPPAPAPAPAATAAESRVPTAVADTASIEAVLGRYRQAFTALDVDAARAVWPAVDARMLGRAFEQLQEQQIEFQHCSVVVNSAQATAACGGRARYVPKVGSRSVRNEPRQWTFSLQKVDGQWLIERVASR